MSLAARLIALFGPQFSTSWASMSDYTSADGHIYNSVPRIDNGAFPAWACHDGNSATFWLDNNASTSKVRMDFTTPRRGYRTTLTHVNGTPGGDRAMLPGTAVWGLQQSDATFVKLAELSSTLQNATRVIDFTSAPICTAYELRTVGASIGVSVMEWSVSFSPQ